MKSIWDFITSHMLCCGDKEEEKVIPWTTMKRRPSPMSSINSTVGTHESSSSRRGIRGMTAPFPSGYGAGSSSYKTARTHFSTPSLASRPSRASESQAQWRGPQLRVASSYSDEGVKGWHREWSSHWGNPPRGIPGHISSGYDEDGKHYRHLVV